jgi:hypothetical protein
MSNKGGGEGIDWIHLAEARDQWRVLLNTVEVPGFIKRWTFLEWLSDCWFLKKDPAPWSQSDSQSGRGIEINIFLCRFQQQKCTNGKYHANTGY